MEQNSRFFIFDSFVFAFKNALANARIFTIAYISFFIANIPLVIILGFSFRALFTLGPIMGAGANWKELLTLQLLQTSGWILLGEVLIGLLLSAWITAGLVRIALRIHDTGEASFSDLFPSLWIIIKLLIANIIFILITVLGFILLFIPGLYFMIRGMFYIYALVEGEGLFEAFSTSFRLTRGKGWQLFALLIMSLAIIKVTLFFGGPIILLSYVYIYRQLKKGA